MSSEQGVFAGLSRETFDRQDDASYIARFQRGLTEELVRHISQEKDEPQWMLDLRLKGLRLFQQKPTPSWGPDLSDLNHDEICYYARAAATVNSRSWEDVPDQIKETFEELGIPQAERAFLAGAGAQYESDTIYHNLKKQWEDKGVIFLDMDEALREHEDLVRQYFMKCVPVHDHKYAALHAAVWSGGTFLYIPSGVEVTEPLQAYFRMNAPGMGQFEHTMIIVEDGGSAHYIEGCSAPKYDSNALHAGCVEIFLGEDCQFRYSSVENWSQDTYNLNTKRALVGARSRMEWVGGNMGSGVTMLYPCSVLKGEGASADHLGIAFANTGQHQDTGAKVYHLAPHTTSKIVSKSLSKGGGNSTFRGIVTVAEQAHSCSIGTECDALLLDELSSTHTIPHYQIHNPETLVAHEASVGKLSEDDMLYLRSRGIPEEQAMGMLVNGFLEPIMRELPLEYAVEMNRLIEIEMEGSVG